jgi:hypothetical protein
MSSAWVQQSLRGPVGRAAVAALILVASGCKSGSSWTAKPSWWSLGSDDNEFKSQRNAMTSPYLWVLATLSVIPAILFWRDHMVLKGFAALFAVTYIWLYWSIVRFNIPSWMSPKR